MARKQVKAMMSDGTERSRQNAGGLLPGWAREARESERAISEAQAILAVSEPEIEGDSLSGGRAYTYYVGPDRYHWPHPVAAHARTILAESLAAFVKKS